MTGSDESARPGPGPAEPVRMVLDIWISGPVVTPEQGGSLASRP